MERDNKAIAVARQCELLGLSRSSYYYSSTRDDEYNLELMRLLDEQYTKVPFYGVRRLTAWLRGRGYIVNPKRVRELMRRMGLQAIYPHKRRGFSSPGHKRYPYLPEIFNTDQGVQFTAQEFSELLSRNEIKISMDGRGRVYDNIFEMLPKNWTGQ